MHRFYRVVVRDLNDLLDLNPLVCQIRIVADCCNTNISVLDLSKYTRLEQLIVGNNSFNCVTEVKLIGLEELESVVIGPNCFVNKSNRETTGCFYLKNCLKLKELWMGRISFSDYSVCEIENVDALETIAMGDAHYWSGCFNRSSLELKSTQRVKVANA